jgi:3-oxoacyl-ACP reductase-like protein
MRKGGFMGVFDSIKNAIFGHHATASIPTTAAATSPAPPVSAAVAQPAAKSSASPSSQQPVVDVEAILQGLAAKNTQRLNWQTSIVDLMKLLGLDSSLQNRMALAKELGYSGDTADSAKMNIWLSQQVMRKLAESGGKVPASLQG